MNDRVLLARIRAAEFRAMLRRWRSDVRGTSMVTSALILPVIIVFLAGFYYLYLMLVQKQALHEGVMDATRYISENARYWPIDPDGRSNVPGDLLPAEFYDMQARRMIESRLRDTVWYSPQQISDTLTVRVQEPILAFHPDSQEEPIPDGIIETSGIEDLCYWRANLEGEWRPPENIRFLVYAEFKVPLWTVILPYFGSFDITLSDRQVGYVQCPRWHGKREAENYDKSHTIGSQGPYRVFRALSTQVPVPTVTEFPTPTRFPTMTPLPPTATPSGP